ncbi:MAG: carboxypeptidase-like regulatory domain-containing protein [Planctomycetaceae bacterium]
MKTSMGSWLAGLALVAMVCPLPVSASEAATVTDVSLSAAGDLHGLVVTDTGLPLANVAVQVVHDKSVVAVVRTDAAGRYVVQSLRPGVHLVRTVEGQQVCRFWNAAGAPPAARQGLVMTASQTIVRGQSCGEDCGEDCCDGGCGRGCGLFGGGGCGLLGGGGGALLPLALFGGAAAVTLASATNGGSDRAVVANQPASP